MCFDVEFIPDEDSISRQIAAPRQYDLKTKALIANELFLIRREEGESVNWRKYATLDQVHNAGCHRQALRIAKGHTPGTYVGALTVLVGATRRLQTKNGFRFDIVHFPTDDQSHAEIQYLRVDRAEIEKGEWTDLKGRLATLFASQLLEPHVCPRA